MSTYQKPRGTNDYFGSNLEQFTYLEQVMIQNAKIFGFQEIRTPIFEHTEIYLRSVGESSDIVNKEIYNFIDKGGRSITLRPEGTAGVIRAINENKFLKQFNYPLRLFYYGPIFRYERPQSGRSRQFHQFGFEILNTNSIYDDVDCIFLASKCLEDLNIHQYHLDINNIGSIQTRKKWIQALKEYFIPFQDQLSADSIHRLQTNPLRILDDKEDGQKPFVKNAPQMEQFLSTEEKEQFQQILKILEKNKIAYHLNPNLVRGLDYYSNFVFEFVSDLKELSGQSTICGGGRYNNLIQDLGGIDAQGVGFAFGLERILIQYQVENQKQLAQKTFTTDATLINLSDNLDAAYDLVCQLRKQNFKICFEPNIKKLNAGFKYCAHMQSKFALILGNQEWQNQQIVLKNQIDLKQQTIAISEIANYLN